MNKMLLKLFIILLLNIKLVNAETTPKNEQGATKELSIKSFYNLNEKTVGIFELQTIRPSFDEHQRSIQIGARYSLSDNSKIGLFIANIQNQKHNNNWIKEGGVWKWNNEKNNENIIYPELSYRNLLGALVYEFKLKYVYSNLFDEKDLLTKLNLMYNTSPSWILILSDEVKFSFSNNEKTISENWIYLSSFYRFNNQFLIGPKIGFFERYWTTSDTFKRLRPGSYLSTDSSVSLGLNINIYLN